jgi:hypothetical protein
MVVMTTGQNGPQYWAGAYDATTGARHHCLGARHTQALFRDLRSLREARQPAAWDTQLSVGGSNYSVHNAKAVAPWVAAHSLGILRRLATRCPRPNPLDRAGGEVHGGCLRHHQFLGVEVADHRRINGPRQYKQSDLYDEPAVTAAVENIAAEKHLKGAA